MEESKKLESVNSTFKNAFKIYRDHLWPIVILNLILSITSFITSFIITGSIFFGLKVLIIGSIISLIISLLFSMPTRFGLAYAFVKKSNAWKSYLFGLKNIFPYLLVLLSMMIVVSLGTAFFIVPGIIFFIFFTFTFFVMADGGDKGISALVKSYYFVKGYFNEIFLRLLLGGILYVLGLIVISLFSGINIYLDLALNSAYNIFALSFLAALNFSLYSNVKHLKPHVISTSVSHRDRNILIVLILIGCAAIIAIAVFVYYNPEIAIEALNKVIQNSR